MADYSPKFTPGADLPLTASAAIIGGQLVAVSGANSVAPTGGSVPGWLGVARQDTAAGGRVTVTRGGVQKITASGAITAGDRVIPAASGKVTTLGAGAVANVVGTALTTVVDGALVLVALDR